MSREYLSEIFIIGLLLLRVMIMVRIFARIAPVSRKNSFKNLALIG